MLLFPLFPAPTVWIAGPAGSDAQLVKAKADLEVLFDAKSNRVTLMVDVPREHHYAVLGRKGEHQRSIMTMTNSHVHFPDLSRGKKSAQNNQVSVTGSPNGAEAARLKVRGLIPLIISFDVPDIVPPNAVTMTDEIRAIGEEFRVTIFFKRRERGPLALVKSTRSRGHIVEQAAEKLLYHWTSSAHLPHYTLQVDISTHVHGNIIGRSGVNVQSMMHLTNTTIRFPRANLDSSIFISGPKDSVKTVHMYLQGLLPLYLVFELVGAQVSSLQSSLRQKKQDYAGELEDTMKAKVEDRFGVTLSCKLRDDGVITVTLKGTEAAYVRHIIDDASTSVFLGG